MLYTNLNSVSIATFDFKEANLSMLIQRPHDLWQSYLLPWDIVTLNGILECLSKVFHVWPCKNVEYYSSTVCLLIFVVSSS